MTLVEYIRKFPGQAKARFRKQIAEKLGVTPEAVRCWETGVRRPRVEYVLKLEEITSGKVTRKEMRPDIYGDLK